jgi:hypothetical protein
MAHWIIGANTLKYIGTFRSTLDKLDCLESSAKSPILNNTRVRVREALKNTFHPSRNPSTFIGSFVPLIYIGDFCTPNSYCQFILEIFVCHLYVHRPAHSGSSARAAT